MKKIFPLLFLVPFFSFAYTSTDVSTANFLADEGIIVKQSVESKYRLNDTITRAEVIGMALKIQGATLPDDYFCKNYFTDVRYNAKNNWVCRAIEIAADKGIISKSNTRARPQDSITRAEALAIIMKAGDIDVQVYTEGSLMEEVGIWDENLTTQVSIPWQRDIFYTYLGEVSKTYLSGTQFVRSDSGSTVIKGIRPNENATRAEVFGFAGSILQEPKGSQIEVRIENRNAVLYENGAKIKNLTNDASVGVCRSGDDVVYYEVWETSALGTLLTRKEAFCQITVQKIDYFIYVPNVGLISVSDFLRNEYNFEIPSDILGHPVTLEGYNLVVQGQLRNDPDNLELVNTFYFTTEQIKDFDITIIRDFDQEGRGQFEWIIDLRNILKN